MIDCEAFGRCLNALGVDTAVGVPDSTLKGLINYFYATEEVRQITAANECEAAGIAMGSYLGSGKPALVYLQNSGLGKIVNPHTSLIAKEIYSIPMLLLIGWRGRPGEKDEPQHVMMGRIMEKLFDCIEIPHVILNDTKWEGQLSQAYEHCMRYSSPFAMVASKSLFDKYPGSADYATGNGLSREAVLETISDIIGPEGLFICTTGKSSRELFEIRERKGNSHGTDVYTVGGMGCATSIAFGLALKKPERKVICIDGDGAALMQLGTMATIGHYQPDNFLHILIDNQSYESTGGQPTISPTVDFNQIGKGCGYSSTITVDSIEALVAELKSAAGKNILKLIIVKCIAMSRSDLGRPTTTPVQNKADFMNVTGVAHGGK